MYHATVLKEGAHMPLSATSTDMEVEQAFLELLKDAVRTQVANPLNPIIGSEIVVEVNYDLPRWRRVDRSRYDVLTHNADKGFPFDQTGRAVVRMTYLAFRQPVSMLDALAAMVLTAEMAICVRPETELLFEQHPDIRLGGELISICGATTVSKGRIGNFYIGATARELSLLNYFIDHKWPVGHKFIFKKK